MDGLSLPRLADVDNATTVGEVAAWTPVVRVRTVSWADGRTWMDLLLLGLEFAGKAAAASDMPICSVVTGERAT